MKAHWFFVASVVLATASFAQESEFKSKLQEDMDSSVKNITGVCGSTPKVEWGGGKLGFNPRQSEKPDWAAVSTLCTAGLDAVSTACNNGAAKEKLAKVGTITCTRGKGAMKYTLKGDKLTVSVDPSFTKNDVGSQRDELGHKMVVDLDT